MPPYHISTQASSTGGSFIVRESSHNRHRFTCARDDLSHPYPSAQDVYVRSNTYNSLEEFSDLSLSDFFIAHRRVARHKLERLELNPFCAGLLSQGVQSTFERREPYNDILEAAMGYTGACGVAVMDEVAIINERVDVTMLQVDLVKDEVETLKEQLRNERELRQQLARSLADARTIANGLVGEVGRLRDQVTGMVMRSVRPVPLAERAQALTPFRGRLVPIGEPIGIVEDSEDGDSEVEEVEGPTTTPDSMEEVVDFGEEEERQAEDARRRDELTSHAEIECARVDPSPEYVDPPLYDD